MSDLRHEFFSKKRFNSNQQFFWKANYYLKRKKIALESRIAPAQSNDKSKKRKEPRPKKNMRPQYLTSPWMLLLVHLSEMNSGVGPSIDSREGKLCGRQICPLELKLLGI